MSSELQLSAFLERHRALLGRERQMEIERSTLLMTNCSPKLLEQKGLALNGLGVVSISVGLGGKTLVELERPTAYHSTPIFPPHTFRPGDIARIEENISGTVPPKKSSKAKKAISETNVGGRGEGVVFKVSDTRIVVAIDPSDSSSDDLDLPERCRIVKLANSVTYDRMEKALNQLEKLILPSSDTEALKFRPPSMKLVEVLMGITLPSDKALIPDINFFDPTLNDSQKEAVRFALESPEVACIHGPPGTGKTHTLIEIIRQLTSTAPTNPKPQRLLVCGASNLSVDNILERLLSIPASDRNGKLKVTRVGHPARVMAHEGVLNATLEVKAQRTDEASLAKDVKNELDTALSALSGKGKSAKGRAPRGSERRKIWEEVKALRKEYRKREGGVVETVLGQSQIVLATCHSAGGRQLYKHTFDVVIIDEATQAMEAVCWIPILKAKKLVLAGDPMQLPPTILSLNERKKKQKDFRRLVTSKTPIVAKEKTWIPSKSTNLPSAPLHDAGTVESTDVRSESSATDDDDEAVIEKDEIDQANSTSAKSVKTPPKMEKKKGGLQPPRTLETTLFDRLEKMYGPEIKRMLNVQYRMNSQISKFPSKMMYSNKLRSHDSVASHLLSDLPNTSGDGEEEKDVLGTPVIFYDTAGCEYFERLDGDGDEGSRCNENEAMVVKTWIERLIGSGVLTSQIAIITPYQAQVTLLTSLLRPIHGLDLEIGTVDGMQGREKDAVVISLVRSNEKREVGFLRDKRRLNVAMTRAKRHLCIVGDSSTVKHGGTFLKNWMAWLETNSDVRYAGLE